MTHFGSYNLCDESFSAATVLWNDVRKIYQLWSTSFGGYVECTDINSDFCGLLPPFKAPKTRRFRPQRKPLPKQDVLASGSTAQSEVDMKVLEDLQATRQARWLRPQKRAPRVTPSDDARRASATVDPLPGQWKPLSMSSYVIPGSLIGYLVDAVAKGNTQTFNKEALLQWFAGKGIVTCGDLAAADKDLWKELSAVIPPSIYNTIEYMIDQVKKAKAQQRQSSIVSPPSATTGSGTCKWVQKDVVSGHNTAERKQFLGSHTKK